MNCFRPRLACLLLLAMCAPLDAQCDVLNARRRLAAARNYILAGNAGQAMADLAEVERQCPSNAGLLTEIGNLRNQASGPKDAAIAEAPATRVSRHVVNKYALVVGAGEYLSPRIPALRFAAKDARDFRGMLVEPQTGRFLESPKYLHLLTGSEATTRNIRIHLDEIAKQATVDDLVVFYISTHGTDARSEGVSEAGRLGYIVTYDTVPEQLYATALPMVELNNWLKRLRAARVIGFLDTCYAGGVIGGSGGKATGNSGIPAEQFHSAVREGAKALLLDDPVETRSRAVAQETGRVIITSSRADQQSWESERLDSGRGNSYFTRFLVDAFRALSAGGAFPDIQQVYREIERTVPAAVQANHKADQMPQIFSNGSVPRLLLGAPVE